MLWSLATTAQTINIHFKNGTKIEYSSVQIDYIDFTEKETPQVLTNDDFVDLGLGVKWANCNLGASKPQEFGGYYSWGETSEKDNYSLSNYSYYNEEDGLFTVMPYDIAGSEYDAATINLGKGWRLPNLTEVNELINECEWKKSDLEGVEGFYITGKNGNSIFLPKVPYKSGSKLRDNGYYWTSDGAGGAPEYAVGIFFDKGYVNTISSSRYLGHQIRPVYRQTLDKKIDNITDYISIKKLSQSKDGDKNIYEYKVSNNSSDSIFLYFLEGNGFKWPVKSDIGSNETVTIKVEFVSSFYGVKAYFYYNGLLYNVKE